MVIKLFKICKNINVGMRCNMVVKELVNSFEVKCLIILILSVIEIRFKVNVINNIIVLGLYKNFVMVVKEIRLNSI